MGACASKQNQIPGGASSTGRHSEDTGAASPMEVLDKVFTVLVDCLQPDPILEKFLNEEYPNSMIRGIMDLETTSQKNRQLLELVRRTGDESYRYLKKHSVKQAKMRYVSC